MTIITREKGFIVAGNDGRFPLDRSQMVMAQKASSPMESDTNLRLVYTNGKLV